MWWFKSRYVESLEKRISQLEGERLQLIAEHKKLVDRLLQRGGVKEVYSEKTVDQTIEEAKRLEAANMDIFSDTDGGLDLHEVLSGERTDN